MATKFDIITQASISLDGNAVSSFRDDTREVEVFQPIYDRVKRSELSSYLWNFNTFTEKLAREAVTPTDGRWRYQYLPPTNLLRIVNVQDANGFPAPYQFETGRIFSNHEELFAKYQRNIDESDLPVFFIDVLVARLAFEAAQPLTGEARVVDRTFQKYNVMLRRARNVDTKENPAPTVIDRQSTWLSAHFGGSRRYGFRRFGS